MEIEEVERIRKGTNVMHAYRFELTLMYYLTKAVHSSWEHFAEDLRVQAREQIHQDHVRDLKVRHEKSQEWGKLREILSRIPS